jgi:hypothetical protein
MEDWKIATTTDTADGYIAFADKHPATRRIRVVPECTVKAGGWFVYKNAYKGFVLPVTIDSASKHFGTFLGVFDAEHIGLVEATTLGKDGANWPGQMARNGIIQRTPDGKTTYHEPIEVDSLLAEGPKILRPAMDTTITNARIVWSGFDDGAFVMAIASEGRSWRISKAQGVSP